MKALFWDFDGVINSWDWQKRRCHVRLHIDPAAVARVERIVELTDAKIVISSSWRHGGSVDWLRGILHASGLNNYRCVIDKTPDSVEQLTVKGLLMTQANGDRFERGHEIAAWLAEHPEFDRIVILDDGSDMAHLADRLVQTTMELGLQDEHVERAAALLEAP